MNTYFQVSVVLPRARVEIVSAELFELGCCGVVEEDISDGVRLTAYFEVAENKAEIEQALRPYECRFEPVPDTDWTLGWRSFFQPVYPTPRMAICPPWDRVPDPPGGFTIAIDPQMAFGTGHHETTRLALLGLEKKITSGDRVLDVGTGSGILSIAAVKLGAAKVMAVDIEAAAIENARANCVLNGVDAQVVLMLCSVDRVSGIFDVVVANIISSILLPIVPELAKRLHPEGYAILGGILDREREAFCTALDRANLVLDEMLDDGEWLCAIARKSQ
ncbi:MAG: 50S ribosomal protein L11 methyltransferase [Gemmatimonadota bacterium]|nr:50S ribosomal protein L11 methyltransferase [Gemmatimonadota bacterium]